MTGTLIGGKASHVRSLLFRLAPESLRAEDLAWEDGMEFAQSLWASGHYRHREGIQRRRQPPQPRQEPNDQAEPRMPGIMPTLYGRHLIGNTIFLSLEDVAATCRPTTST